MGRPKEILFISHDANRAGAQIFLYNAMSFLKTRGYKIVLLLVNEWGSFREELETDFVTYSMVAKPKTTLDRFFKSNTTVFEHIKAKHSIDLIYANTIASVHILEELKTTFGAPVITHIHELAYSIQQYGCAKALEHTFKFSDQIIACSNAVAANLSKYGNPNKIEVVHSFVNNDKILRLIENSNKFQILRDFGLEENFTWVCACGNADWRKAPDIFVQIAANTNQSNVKFAWIGIKSDDSLKAQLQYDAEKLGVNHKIAWIEPTPRAVELINAMDFFLLCSREDPFPLVMLEAALCEKPILGFENTGGGDEFIQDDAGVRVSYLNVQEMANAISGLDKAKAAQYGYVAKQKVLDNYSYEKSMLKIENLIENFF